jgi:hypothetical protein
VRGDHLRDLVRLEPGLGREIAPGSDVSRTAVTPGERLVGDALDERLQKADLTPLGRK